MISFMILSLLSLLIIYINIYGLSIVSSSSQSPPLNDSIKNNDVKEEWMEYLEFFGYNTSNRDFRCIIPEDLNDGFGSQLRARIACMISSREKEGYYYIHRPFDTPFGDHASDITTEEANKLLNIPSISLSIFDNHTMFPNCNIKEKTFCPTIKEFKYFETFMRDRLRERLFMNKDIEKRIYFSNNKWLKVSVHIRLINDDVRITTNDAIIYMVYSLYNASIKTKWKDNINITIYVSHIDITHHSYNEKHLNNLKERIYNITKRDVIISKNGKLIDDWIHFINSDILITAKSTFSITAAYYNNGGIVILPTLANNKELHQFSNFLIGESTNLTNEITSILLINQ